VFRKQEIIYLYISFLVATLVNLLSISRWLSTY